VPDLYSQRDLDFVSGVVVGIVLGVLMMVF